MLTWTMALEPGGPGSAALYIDIDKKYFESWKSRVRYVLSHHFLGCLILRYVPSDLVTDSSKYTHHASKTQKNKVMMFAAVYRPRLDLADSLDGKLMLKVAHNPKVPFHDSSLSLSCDRHKKTSLNSQVRVSYHFCLLRLSSLSIFPSFLKVRLSMITPAT